MHRPKVVLTTDEARALRALAHGALSLEEWIVAARITPSQARDLSKALVAKDLVTRSPKGGVLDLTPTGHEAAKPSAPTHFAEESIVVSSDREAFRELAAEDLTNEYLEAALDDAVEGL